MATQATDVSIQAPFSMLLCGPSGCGKSYLIRQLIESDMLVGDMRKKLWVSDTGDPQIAGVEYCEGGLDILDNTELYNQPGLIIIDDLGHLACNDRRVSDLFTKKRHHSGLSVILVLQNLFNPGKYTRTITQNAQYLVYFRNPRDSGVIYSLSRQMNPTNVQFLIQAYKHACKKPYGYLFINLTQQCPDELRYQTDICSPITTVYVI